MPDTSFEKAPVVEIIAELRWIPADIAAPAPVHPGQQSITFTLAPPPSLDQLFSTFNGEVYQQSFRQVERLVPPGSPIVLHQPSFRFRKEQSPALLQLGLGLFSANAIQPYRSWLDFKSTVKLGIDALLKARITAERGLPFSLHSLRYINAFGPDLLNGQPIAQFLSDTLGFALALPAPVADLIAEPTAIKSHCQYVIPIKDTNKTLTLSIGEGTLATAPGSLALIMDMTVTEQNVDPNETTIMEAFDSSRAIIHKTFYKMTEKIHPLMRPRQAS
jgi:uncharacterized protein (TIGR04255 family)